MFRICLLNSTANPAQFGWKLAGLAVLFSRQILNGSREFYFSLTFLFLFIFLDTNCAQFMYVIFYNQRTLVIQQNFCNVKPHSSYLRITVMKPPKHIYLWPEAWIQVKEKRATFTALSCLKYINEAHKGQLISEWLLNAFIWTKIRIKIFLYFCHGSNQLIIMLILVIIYLLI